MLKAISAAVVLTVIITGCTAVETPKNTASEMGQEEKLESLRRQRDAVVKFFEPMKVRPGDWLDTQRELGETFEEYISANPTLPTDVRRTIYIQPIGRFTSEQLLAIDRAAEYMRAFYSLPVRLNSAKPLGEVPFDKKRLIKYRNNLQIKTSYFLDDLLPKLLPSDAAALLAFTNYDLYPEPTRAFVFGQASLNKRIGVWSLYHFADPKTGKNDPKLLLERTLKIAMHESGHMFSMKHCTKYECLMSGTNHLAETDRRPLDNCPECMAKVAWAMGYEPKERYEQLAEFWRRNGRPDEERRMRQKAAAVAAAK